ncbi:hypothetical protein [Clostridium perfringens]|uniref:Uncharacterized protein n=1 Tax=Clostridium perfringens TaxID=1502 RepID=A0A140GQV9_CLOPF|nr:hypothetical protein [Clostridium perfringens]AMN30918.1 hypothetical protein JFP838_pA0002 [Clostridium perfringens]
MDKFKMIVLKEHGYEMDYSKELGKRKIPSTEKRTLRKVARRKLKRNLIKTFEGII